MLHYIGLQIRMNHLTTLLLLACSAICLAQLPDIPETVPELDVPKYLGRWFQTYASPIVMETFEKNAVCVTADYGVYNATVLTVYNANRNVTPDGALNTIRGFAYTTDEPGKLWVGLDGGEEGGGPYWIVKLGPKEFGPEKLYDYAIVTDPLRFFLFVLTRDVTRFRSIYEDDVLTYLRENGFDTPANYPIRTYQESDCQYAPKPSKA